MAISIVRGDSANAQVANDLVEQVQGHLKEGTVYVGYPVLAGVDGSISVDLLVVGPQIGLVAVLIASTPVNDETSLDKFALQQDALFAALESHLSRYPALREGRKFAVPIQTFTIVPPGEQIHARQRGDANFSTAAELGARLPDNEISQEVYRALESALQRVTTIKPARRREAITDSTSRGGVLRTIEKKIANLDQWQKQAAIESPDGPQRIRGLAGSGKTIVLALKAAYWHVQHPEWSIAVTFQTRSLYQQLEDLTTRFTFAHGEDAVDPEFLQIRHAWGSMRRGGLYQQMAQSVGAPARDFNYARSKFGMDQAFRGICVELLEHCKAHPPEPIFDAVLIDEAQDLPAEFFQLVWLFTRDPHRVVWAYDELQILSESTMPSLVDMYGTDENGRERFELRNDPGRAKQDIMLPVCYRNTPWALTLAHALGFGIYRDGGLVQHFDEPALWSQIGYEVLTGELELGQRVSLQRGRDNTPEYFHTMLNSDDAVVADSFASTAEQDSWIADCIRRNLEEDELDAEDILVVLPNSYDAKRRFDQLQQQLVERGLNCHMPGYTAPVDAVFLSGSIAITHIHRAKGNEAAMVYVADCEHATAGSNKVTRRNTIFTAITRSRAWVRLGGVGENFAALLEEVKKVRESQWKLSFQLPTPEQLESLRRVNRERGRGREEGNDRVLAELEKVLHWINKGQLKVSDLSPRQKTLLARFTDGANVDP